MASRSKSKVRVYQHNRTYMCGICGKLFRLADRGREVQSLNDYLHCDRPVIALSHEQAVAAQSIQPKKRVDWLRKGAHIVKKGKNKWLPATSKWQIEVARQQLRLYTRKKSEWKDNEKTSAIVWEIVEKYAIGLGLQLAGGSIPLSAQKDTPFEQIQQNPLFVRELIHKIDTLIAAGERKAIVKTSVRLLAVGSYPLTKDNPKVKEWWEAYMGEGAKAFGAAGLYALSRLSKMSSQKRS